MDNWQDKTEWKDLWLLTPEQVPLLSGMTDKGRLGFAIQLKFMEMYGRFPSSGKDVSMDVIQYLAQQLGLSGDLFSSYEPLGIGRGCVIARRSGSYSAIALLLTVISGSFLTGCALRFYPWIRKHITPEKLLLTGFASNAQSLLQQHILSGLFVRQHTIMKRPC